MFILYGEEIFNIENTIKKIEEKYNNYQKKEIIYFDNLNEIIDEIDSENLFFSNKLIVIKKFPYFTKKIDIENKKNIDAFLKSLERNTNDLLIFVVDEIDNLEKLNNNIFTSFLKQNKSVEWKWCQKISLSQIPNEIIKIVKENNGQISFEDAILLQNKLPNDMKIISYEVQKLLFENKHISKEQINTSISNYYNEDIYSFSNAFNSKNFFNIWSKYSEKINFNIEISNLISQINNLFVISSKIYFFLLDKKNFEYISKELKINIFRIKKIYQILEIYGIIKIKAIIIFLADLDYEIKIGKIKPEIGFEQFLIKFFAN
ncbi:DNA polymerase III subunit delta [Mycoplasmopsis lipophila]|uniref:DNA polymerase III subunit delta n=1 Tax=Mycoplasmopsis lipophila TaxID=2117 RepID=UPI00387363EC